jgi:hypothetical protein
VADAYGFSVASTHFLPEHWRKIRASHGFQCPTSFAATENILCTRADLIKRPKIFSALVPIFQNVRKFFLQVCRSFKTAENAFCRRADLFKRRFPK